MKEQSIISNNDVCDNIFKRKRKLEGMIKGVHQQLDPFPYYDLIQLEKDL